MYSDIGFMILEWVVSQKAGKPLDQFVAEQIYGPLGLENLFFPGRRGAAAEKAFAATEFCPWRNCLMEGVVHDENAYVVGGVGGHAGLFGNAASVNALLSILTAAFHGDSSGGVFQADSVRNFLARRDDTQRALGFDCPSPVGSSAGRFFPKTSVGHLGFTGTSFWMDLDRSITVILLSNRIHPSRDNRKIKAFRPELHDAVMREMTR
jgi:CubicO group peptidase (beta-lactamase class C family)